VSGGESKKVVPVDSVLAPGESESGQVSLFNPAQDGYFADAAVSGDDSGGEIFRVDFIRFYCQMLPPWGHLLTLFT
jgi:hypothetical protein